VPGRRILVISNETVTGTVLHEAIRFRARNVAARSSSSRPRSTRECATGCRDSDRARRAAEARLAASLERLTAVGVHARGQIGDGDPMQAIADALELFPADEIIIADAPEERSNWLAHDLVTRAGFASTRRSSTSSSTSTAAGSTSPRRPRARSSPTARPRRSPRADP